MDFGFHVLYVAGANIETSGHIKFYFEKLIKLLTWNCRRGCSPPNLMGQADLINKSYKPDILCFIETKNIPSDFEKKFRAIGFEVGRF